MSIQRTLQKCMEDWKQISNLDFCLLQEDNSVFVTTCQKRLPSLNKLADFRSDPKINSSKFKTRGIFPRVFVFQKGRYYVYTENFAEMYGRLETDQQS